MAWTPLGRSSLIALALTLTAAGTPQPQGSKAFVARPAIGKAEFNLPSAVNWTAARNPSGAYRVTVTAVVDASSVLANIKGLSAKALDRSIPCGDVVKVLSAAAKLVTPTKLRYDLRFHYVKRVCAGTVPVSLESNINCSANIAVFAARAIVVIDVKGAREPPCRIEGVYQSVSDAVYAIVGMDVFKRHTVNLATLLPPEFKGVTISIRSLAFDLPPAPARMRIAGESTMSAAQYDDLVARLEAASPKTN